MRGLLREKLFNKHYNKLLGSRAARTSSSVNTISSVTILVPSKYASPSDVRQLRQYFEGMQLSVYLYLVKEKGEHVEDLNSNTIIDLEECEWYGVPTQEILIQWLAHKTDLLIVNDPDRLPIMRYLTAASNSKLKSTIYHSSLKREDYDIDMWIDASDQHPSLLDQCRLTYETLSKLGVGPPVIG